MFFVVYVDPVEGLIILTREGGIAICLCTRNWYAGKEEH